MLIIPMLKVNWPMINRNIDFIKMNLYTISN